MDLSHMEVMLVVLAVADSDSSTQVSGRRTDNTNAGLFDAEVAVTARFKTRKRKHEVSAHFQAS